MADPKTNADDKWQGCPPLTMNDVADTNFLKTLYGQAVAAIRANPDHVVRLESYPNGWPEKHSFVCARIWLRARNIDIGVTGDEVSVIWTGP